MNVFDSVAHSMTTIATGGFSTHNVSIGFLDNSNIEIFGSLFMILGSLPFNSYHENPEYAKNILLSEAIVLMIGQIADMPASPEDDNEDGEDSPLTTDNNSDEVREELTAAQKKLPQGLQDAIAKKQGGKKEETAEQVTEDQDLEKAETVPCNFYVFLDVFFSGFYRSVIKDRIAVGAVL